MAWTPVVPLGLDHNGPPWLGQKMAPYNKDPVCHKYVCCFVARFLPGMASGRVDGRIIPSEINEDPKSTFETNVGSIATTRKPTNHGKMYTPSQLLMI